MTAPRSVRRLVAAGVLACSLAACTDAPGTAPAEPVTTQPPATATGSPTSRPAPEPPATITLTVVGDLMLGRGVAAVHRDPTVTLRALAPMLRRADITVGTLESTLSTNGSPTQGGDSFAADPGV